MAPAGRLPFDAATLPRWAFGAPRRKVVAALLANVGVRGVWWLLLLLASLARAEDAGVGAANCAIEAELRGLRPGGTVWVLLFDEPKAFPTVRDRARKRIDATPVDGGAGAAFEGLTCGAEYAVAVVHDENGNGRLDTNFIGIPSEGLGSSRDAKGLFGPPSFADAKIVTRGRMSLPITVRY